MKNLLLVVLLMSPAAAGAAPSHCDVETISDISSSGSLIQLSSGQNFLVYPGQDTISILWEPQDKVTVCALGGAAYQIANSGRNHGTVDVLRQF